MISVRNQRVQLFCLLAALTAPLASALEIAVDVGHSLRDPGAVSARGIDEYVFNRHFAGVLAEQLREKSIRVREINFAGDIAGLPERPRQAIGSDFFVSIHHDSISEPYLEFWDWDGEAQRYTTHKEGYGLFVSSQNPDLKTSLRCASAMGAMMRRAGFQPTMWHGRKHRAADAENGVWFYDRLVVLYRTTLPAVLVEAGVIKHREEELALRDPLRQARMADALATGLAACLQVKEIPAPE